MQLSILLATTVQMQWIMLSLIVISNNKKGFSDDFRPLLRTLFLVVNYIFVVLHEEK